MHQQQELPSAPVLPDALANLASTMTGATPQQRAGLEYAGYAGYANNTKTYEHFVPTDKTPKAKRPKGCHQVHTTAETTTLLHTAAHLIVDTAYMAGTPNATAMITDAHRAQYLAVVLAEFFGTAHLAYTSRITDADRQPPPTSMTTHRLPLVPVLVPGTTWCLVNNRLLIDGHLQDVPSRRSLIAWLRRVGLTGHVGVDSVDYRVLYTTTVYAARWRLHNPQEAYTLHDRIRNGMMWRVGVEVHTPTVGRASRNAAQGRDALFGMNLVDSRTKVGLTRAVYRQEMSSFGWPYRQVADMPKHVAITLALLCQAAISMAPPTVVTLPTMPTQPDSPTGTGTRTEAEAEGIQRPSTALARVPLYDVLADMLAPDKPTKPTKHEAMATDKQAARQLKQKAKTLAAQAKAEHELAKAKTKAKQVSERHARLATELQLIDDEHKTAIAEAKAAEDDSDSDSDSDSDDEQRGRKRAKKKRGKKRKAGTSATVEIANLKRQMATSEVEQREARVALYQQQLRETEERTRAIKERTRAQQARTVTQTRRADAGTARRVYEELESETADLEKKMWAARKQDCQTKSRELMTAFDIDARRRHQEHEHKLDILVPNRHALNQQHQPYSQQQQQHPGALWGSTVGALSAPPQQQLLPPQPPVPPLLPTTRTMMDLPPVTLSPLGGGGNSPLLSIGWNGAASSNGPDDFTADPFADLDLDNLVFDLGLEQDQAGAGAGSADTGVGADTGAGVDNQQMTVTATATMTGNADDMIRLARTLWQQMSTLQEQEASRATMLIEMVVKKTGVDVRKE